MQQAHPTTFPRVNGARSRQGNALVAAMGLLVIVSGMVLVSSTRATAILDAQDASQRGLRAMAALEAVLARREVMVSRMATDGSLAAWTGDAGQKPNYGLDVVGDCLVKWKIEPARTVISKDLDRTLTTNELPFITNPLPGSIDGTQPTNIGTKNGYSFMYRVAAEATLPGNENGREAPSRAQGVRYVAVSKAPLFTCVINYLRDGPAGDLELTHGPSVSINGKVNSNGAIYIGADTPVNDWASRTGSNGDTVIGSSTAPVEVQAVSGIFRLSKPLIYGALNGLTLANGGAISSPGSYYDLTSDVRAPEELAPANTFSAATREGRLFNPYRVKDGTGATDWTTVGSAVRSINGVSLIGQGSSANDSRDISTNRAQTFAERAPKSATDGGFSGYVKTDQYQAQRLSIPEKYAERGLEPQLLVQRDADGDASTDEHELSLPVFAGMLPAKPSASRGAIDQITRIDHAVEYWNTVLGRSDPVQLLEEPGSYLKQQIGDFRMARKRDGTGWTLVTSAGDALSNAQQEADITDDPKGAGLIIRERPVPQTDYWPGSTDPKRFITANNREAVPYFPGKHWKPVLMPFTPVDVVSRLDYGDTNGDLTWTGISNAGFGRRHEDTPSRSVLYSRGLTVITSSTQVPLGGGNESIRPNTPNTTDPAIPGRNPAAERYPRADHYFSDTWRMAHLATRNALTNTEIANLPRGLRYWFWNDDANLDTTVSADNVNNYPAIEDGRQRQPFLGQRKATGTTNSTTGISSIFPWGSGAPPTGLGLVGNTNDNISVRWSGYIIPPTSGSYQFQMFVDDGARVWLDDRLILEQWAFTGGWTSSAVVNLVKDEPVKIVAEAFEQGGGEAFNLQWLTPGAGSFAAIPNDVFRAAPEAGGFTQSGFKSVITRLDLDELTAAPAGGKAALMIRPVDAEVAMTSGRDRYLALGYARGRGVFLERRLQPSEFLNRFSPAQWYWVGGGSYQQGAGPVVNNARVPRPHTQSGFTITRTPATLTRGAVPTPTFTNQAITSSTSGFIVTAETTPTITPNVNLGEGIVANIRSGPWTKSGYYRRTKRARTTWTRPITFNFSAGVTYPAGMQAPFPSISLYNDTNTTTTTSVEYTIASGYAVLADRSGITFNQSGNVDNTVTADSASLSTGLSNSNQIWSNGGWPSGYTGATLVAKLNLMGWNGRSDWVLGANNGNGPSNPAVPAIPLADPTWPSNPTPPAAGYDTAAHSFAMVVTTADRLYIDTNPWITASMKWLPAAATMNRPWSSVPAPSSDWSGTIFGITQPLSFSVRPDLGTQAGLDAELGRQGAGRYVGTGGNPAIAMNPGAGPDIGAMTDDIARPATNSRYLWLRIRKPAANTFACDYIYTDTATEPAETSTAWMEIAVNGGITVTAGEWESLLIGPAVQSRSATAMSVNFAETAVFTTQELNGAAGGASGDERWDRVDWEGSVLPGPASRWNRWLASQYQVWFGGADITEDFFTWGDDINKGTPVADEYCFYQPREFWSQGPSWQVWNDAAAPTGSYLWSEPAGRSIWSPSEMWRHIRKAPGEETDVAKTTVLNLDLGRVFDYLRNRDITQARTKVITDSVSPPNLMSDAPLAARFNGIIYVARTNRYPFNPNQALVSNLYDADAYSATADWDPNPRDAGGANPWSFHPTDANEQYPNRGSNVSSGGSVTPGSGAYPLTNSSWTSSTLTLDGVPKLNPYPDIVVRPVRPQNFHHGVMISNAKSVQWSVKTSPNFGDQGLNIVTPNAIYLNGDFNSMANPILVNNTTVNKVANAAVNADSINLLSNGWTARNLPLMKSPAILNTPLNASAESTTYNAGLITHNQPTIIQRVIEGQGAAFIDTMLFLENWSGKTMNFTGSLVVLDSRRYTEGFLLDGVKSSGRGPFGYQGSAYLGWPTDKGGPPPTNRFYDSTNSSNQSLPTTNVPTPQVYWPPNRIFTFQEDFTTKEGNPPFAPYGMTSTGIGGWARLVE